MTLVMLSRERVKGSVCNLTTLNLFFLVGPLCLYSTDMRKHTDYCPLIFNGSHDLCHETVSFQ